MTLAPRPEPGGGVCRACREPIHELALDLGEQPLADALLRPQDVAQPEFRTSLRLLLCTSCLLLQLAPFAETLPYAIHGHGEAFSSTAQAHLASWADRLISQLHLGEQSSVIDVSSGEGYLLRSFQERGISVLGVDRDPDTAARAMVPTIAGEFGTKMALALIADGVQADLVLVNHALAHTDDLDDFVAGLELLLAPDGAIALEFHHVIGLARGAQFDIVSHRHRSYLSLLALEPVLERNGIKLIDATTTEIHGGSVQALAARRDGVDACTRRIEEVRSVEHQAGLHEPHTYLQIASQAAEARQNLLEFLNRARASGHAVSGYGAPSRGTTMLNYCGVTPELMPFTVDRSPQKQNHFLPGCHIPVLAPDAILEQRPSHVLILPWTLSEEIMHQLTEIRSWGAKFVVALPQFRVIE